MNTGLSTDNTGGRALPSTLTARPHQTPRCRVLKGQDALDVLANKPKNPTSSLLELHSEWHSAVPPS